MAWALDAVAAAGVADRLVVVAPRRRWEEVGSLAAAAGLPAPAFVEGGERRRDSVAAALPFCESAEIVVVHDAARPLCPPDAFRRVVDAAREVGAATTAVPVADTVKRVDEQGRVVVTVDRRHLVATQTPQAFRREVLRDAHAASDEDAVDDCILVESLGLPVVVVDGDPRNLKITRPPDLEIAEAILQRRLASPPGEDLL